MIQQNIILHAVFSSEIHRTDRCGRKHRRQNRDKGQQRTVGEGEEQVDEADENTSEPRDGRLHGAPTAAKPQAHRRGFVVQLKLFRLIDVLLRVVGLGRWPRRPRPTVF